MARIPSPIILEGETVLWAGRSRSPGPFLQVDALPLLLVLLASCLGAPLWLQPLAERPLSLFNLIPVLFFVVFIAALALWYVLLTIIIPAWTYYSLTDKRIVVSVFSQWHLERSIALSDIANVTMTKRKGTRGSIAFGVPSGALMRHLSILDLVRIPPLGFNNIDDVQHVYQLIMNAKTRGHADIAA